MAQSKVGNITARQASAQPENTPWLAAWSKLGSALATLLKQPPSMNTSQGYDPGAVLEAVASVSAGLARQPQKLVEIQMQVSQ